MTSPLKVQEKAKGAELLGNLNGQQHDTTLLSEDVNQGKKQSWVLGSKSNTASVCIRMRNRHLKATTVGGLRATHCQQLTICWHPFKRIQCLTEGGTEPRQDRSCLFQKRERLSLEKATSGGKDVNSHLKEG